MNRNVIVLLGLKHSGKSTLGKMLAQKLGYEFEDTDSLIEAATGMSVRDYYTKNGPNAFMLVEEEVCKELSENLNARKIVIATGGGICDNPPALMHLKAQGQFVLLNNDIRLSVERIVKKVEEVQPGVFTNIPAFIRNQNPETIDDIKKMLRAKFIERTELYKGISDVTVDLQDASKETNLDLIYNAIQ